VAPAQIALWQLLTCCAEAVAAVMAGRSLTEALSAPPPALRPGTQALAFTVMRRLGLAQQLRRQLVPKRPAAWVDGLLLTALALATGTEYPAHTLVDQAVNAAKRRARPASAMVNAVLRRFERERDAQLAQALTHELAQWNHPDWWVAKLRQDWPEHWQALLASNQQAAPMMLRVNARHGSRDAYMQRLEATGISATPFGDVGLTLAQGVAVQKLPGFEQGDVSVQDASAQMSATLLLSAGLRPGARVLDACSAPGGKTAHLLEAQDLDMLALDVDAERLGKVADTLGRLGLHARTQAADAAQVPTWWDGQPFDAILLDAPCSASGIVRRHPDVRWLRRPEDIAALAQTQDRLLDALWPLLAPGGALLYCTCSLFKQEGQDRIDAFLQRQPQALALAAPGHLIPVVEYADTPVGHPLGDGFFYALLRKPLAA
jgi:16S rRNA (cytosine967-C5)-methyltransferase